MNPQELKEKLIQELSLEHLPQQQQEHLIAEFAEALLERITVVALAQLPEEDFKELNALLDAGKQEEVTQRLQQLLPELPQLAEQVIADGIAEFKELLKQQQTEQTQDKTEQTPAVASADAKDQKQDAAAVASEPQNTAQSPQGTNPYADYMPPGFQQQQPAASQQQAPATPQAAQPHAPAASIVSEIDDPAEAAELAAKLPPQDPLAQAAPQQTQQQMPPVTEEHLVVNEAGEAVAAEPESPLINPTDANQALNG